ncbi:MAG: hypothetical protein NTU73_05405, partial [Ignavibacteriae bacterium]|nr:hypothetical protein [Ignavibacteriota bacterium]
MVSPAGKIEHSATFKERQIKRKVFAVKRLFLFRKLDDFFRNKNIDKLDYKIVQLDDLLSHAD